MLAEEQRESRELLQEVHDTLLELRNASVFMLEHFNSRATFLPLVEYEAREQLQQVIDRLEND